MPKFYEQIMMNVTERLFFNALVTFIYIHIYIYNLLLRTHTPVPVTMWIGALGSLYGFPEVPLQT